MSIFTDYESWQKTQQVYNISDQITNQINQANLLLDQIKAKSISIMDGLIKSNDNMLLSMESIKASYPEKADDIQQKITELTVLNNDLKERYDTEIKTIAEK